MPRDKDGKLTREEMVHVIQEEGGSVTYKGRVIDRVDDLPDEVELIGDDEGGLEELRAQLRKERAALDAKLARLGKDGGGDEEGGTTKAKTSKAKVATPEKAEVPAAPVLPVSPDDSKERSEDDGDGDGDEDDDEEPAAKEVKVGTAPVARAKVGTTKVK